MSRWFGQSSLSVQTDDSLLWRENEHERSARFSNEIEVGNSSPSGNLSRSSGNSSGNLSRLLGALHDDDADTLLNLVKCDRSPDDRKLVQHAQGSKSVDEANYPSASVQTQRSSLNPDSTLCLPETKSDYSIGTQGNEQCLTRESAHNAIEDYAMIACNDPCNGQPIAYSSLSLQGDESEGTGVPNNALGPLESGASNNVLDIVHEDESLHEFKYQPPSSITKEQLDRLLQKNNKNSGNIVAGSESSRNEEPERQEPSTAALSIQRPRPRSTQMEPDVSHSTYMPSSVPGHVAVPDSEESSFSGMSSVTVPSFRPSAPIVTATPVVEGGRAAEENSCDDPEKVSFCRFSIRGRHVHMGYLFAFLFTFGCLIVAVAATLKVISLSHKWDRNVPKREPGSTKEEGNMPMVFRFCGCEDCTEDVWNTVTSENTCGGRITFLRDFGGLTEAGACAQVAGVEFRDLCGACDPNTCDELPSSEPSFVPSAEPSSFHSSRPSHQPSWTPSRALSLEPSLMPSGVPTSLPSEKLSKQPSFIPSSFPSSMPSAVEVVTVCNNDTRISTGFDGTQDKEHQGIMFDIYASPKQTIEDLRILGFDLNLDGKGRHEVRLFARNGTHVGYEDKITAWTDLGVYSVEGNNLTEPSLQLNSPIVITPGIFLALYFVQLNGDEFKVYDPENKKVGAVLFSDQTLEVLVGTGKYEKTEPFEDANNKGVGFSGAIYYGLCRSFYPKRPTTSPTDLSIFQSSQPTLLTDFQSKPPTGLYNDASLQINVNNETVVLGMPFQNGCRDKDIEEKVRGKSQLFHHISNRSSVNLFGNTWKAFPLEYEIQWNTVLEFDFTLAEMTEIHAICLDDDLYFRNDPANLGTVGRCFQLAGTDDNSYLAKRLDPPAINITSHYRIPAGRYFTGDVHYLGFVSNSNEDPSLGNAFFANIKIYKDEFTDVPDDSPQSNIKLAPGEVIVLLTLVTTLSLSGYAAYVRQRSTRVFSS